MATPQQRPDPARPTEPVNRQPGPEPVRRPADFRELETRGLRSRGSGAGWLAWWWVWLVVILCAVWFAGWGWGGYGGWWWGNRGTAYGYPAATANGTTAGAAGTGAGTTANMNMVTGSGAVVLASTDKRSYIGRPFQVNDAVVTKKVNDHVLWIGQDNTSGNGASMLVVLQGAGNTAANAHLAQGDLVSVTGTVDRAPSRGQAKQNWKLSGTGQKRLEQQGAYVAASQVQVESNNG